MERAYRRSTLALSAIVLVLGIVMVAVSLGRGSGPVALGTLVGVSFVVLGAGRLVLAGGLRRGRS